MSATCGGRLTQRSQVHLWTCRPRGRLAFLYEQEAKDDINANETKGKTIHWTVTAALIENAA
jgi:hypothetical protein